MYECRKKIAKEKECVPSPKDTNEHPKSEPSHGNSVACYGCGKTGYFRSNCPNCSRGKLTSMSKLSAFIRYILF